MTRKQHLLFLFTVSVVVSTILGVGILAWGWPFWLLPAVAWVCFPPLAVFTDRFIKDEPVDERGTRSERHRAAGAH